MPAPDQNHVQWASVRARSRRQRKNQRQDRTTHQHDRGDPKAVVHAHGNYFPGRRDTKTHKTSRAGFVHFSPNQSYERKRGKGVQQITYDAPRNQKTSSAISANLPPPSLMRRSFVSRRATVFWWWRAMMSSTFSFQSVKFISPMFSRHCRQNKIPTGTNGTNHIC